MTGQPSYLVFPGQGSQMLGMGKQLYKNHPEARSLFGAADDCISYKLSAVMFGDDDAKLKETAFAQPALLTVSACVFEVMMKLSGATVTDFCCVAGHSLGEYSALYATGVLSFTDAVRLVHMRGKAMQQAVPIGMGGMVSVMGTEIADVEALVNQASSKGVIAIANDNAPGQVVVAGDTPAIEALTALAKMQKLRIIPLAVSAPFHSPLMKPAAVVMEDALATTTMKDALVPVVCNTTAQPQKKAEELRKALVNQICDRVRWRESIDWIADNYDGCTQIECGSRKVLTGLIKRIRPETVAISLEEPADIEAWAKAYVNNT